MPQLGSSKTYFISMQYNCHGYKKLYVIIKLIDL